MRALTAVGLLALEAKWYLVVFALGFVTGAWLF